MGWFLDGIVLVPGRRKLPTLEDYVDDRGLEPLFENSALTEAEELIIYDWFFERRLATPDFDRFTRWFQRKLQLNESQYLAYRRVETTDFDPVVTRYLERQVKNASDANAVVTGSNEGSLKTVLDATVSGNTTDTGTAILTSEQSNHQTGQGEGTNETTGKTATVDSSTQGSTSDTHTEGTSDTRTTTTGTENTKGLQGELPYNARSTSSGVSVNWTYASSQTENDKTDSSTQNVHGSTESDTHVGTDTTTRGNSTTDSETSGTSGYSESMDGTVNRSDTTTRDDKGTSNSQTDSTTTSTNTLSSQNNQQTSGTSDLRERYTGRDKSAQELLNTARNYITRTNAMQWLLSQLERVFLGVHG